MKHNSHCYQSCFGYSISNSNMRNLSLDRLTCKLPKYNMLHQCCKNNVLFKGESYQLSLVGITNIYDSEGTNIVSILDGSSHPLLKVIPLSKESLQRAFEKCLLLNDPGQEQSGTYECGDSLEGYVGRFISAVNQINPQRIIWKIFVDTLRD